MGIQKVTLNPGIVTTFSQTLNASGWSKSNLIRWRTGLPEKIGGWAQLSPTAVSGTARGLHAFADLSGNNYLAIGTNSNLQILYGGNLYYITPVASTSNVTVAVSTVSGSTSVVVKDTTYTSNVGDFVSIDTPVSVGGIVVYGVYQVQATGTNTFTITVPTAASSTVTNGGAVPVFNTTNGSKIVKVTLNNNGNLVNGTFEIDVSTTVGGITLSGIYLITSIIDSNNFNIQTSTSATSTATASENSGNIQIVYFISSGPVSDIVVAGYGGGGYGLGGYGVGTTTSNAITPARLWSLDNFGQNLVAVPTNGSLYQWVPPLDTNLVPGNEAAIVSNAPPINTAMFVSTPAEQVVLIGSSYIPTGGSTYIQDPLLVAWCDIGVITTWTATTTNQAGTYRLSKGSKIVGGLQAQQYGLIWTDTDLWSMQYINLPFVYSFNMIAQNCGLIATKAAVLLAGDAYWPSRSGFFKYNSGSVNPLQCPVFDNVFNNIDYSNVDKSFMAGNSLFNEWMYFFPSASGGTGEIDSYVKYNVLENLWDYGSLVRTCWTDQNILGPPIGVDGNGIIQQHEQGCDANGSAMTNVYVESGYVDISDGTIFIFMDWLIPDILMTGSNPSVTLTVYTVNYPGDTPTAFGPYTVTPTTKYITVRCRARQMAIKVESDSLGTFWRVGAIRYRGIRSGRVG